MGTGLLESGVHRTRDRFSSADREYIARVLQRVTKDGVIIQSDGGVMVYFNQKACDLLRMSPDDLSGRTSLDPSWQAIHLDGSDYPGETHPTMRVLAGADPVVGDVMGVRVGDLTMRWLSVDAIPLHLEAGLHAVAVFTDITNEMDNRRRLAETLDDMKAMLLPPQMPSDDRIRIASRYHSMGMSDSIGGDFYGADRWGPNRYGVFLGDVCGHGIQAAVLGSVARSTIRATGPILDDPSAILWRLHEVVLAERPDTFLTAACAVVDLAPDPDEGAEVALSTGGHHAAFIVSEGRCTQFGTAGPLIGMIANSERPVRRSILQPGDRMLLFSDGVFETGTPRLQPEDLMAMLPTELPVHDLVDWMLERTGDVGQRDRPDDASVIGLEIL
ncbi:MAG: SpoIIE family protein phosphatase [Actinomycetota bacterium]